MDYKHDDPELENLITKTALLMARHCVRNTVLEDYHKCGKISDPEMKVLNKEVVNKIYSFLQLLFNPKLDEAKKLLFKNPYFAELPDWDPPTFDNCFLKSIEVLQRDNKKRE